MNWSRFRTYNIVLFGSIAIGYVVALWWGWLAALGLSPDRISLASQMIVQIDSFLVAGYTVGIFHFYGNLTKGFRELRSLLYEQSLMSPEKVQYLLTKEGKRLTHLSSDKIITMMTVIAFFVLSALSAVSGVLTQNLTFIEHALLYLVLAIVSMMVVWYLLHSASEELGNALEAYLSPQRQRQETRVRIGLDREETNSSLGAGQPQLQTGRAEAYPWA